MALNKPKLRLMIGKHCRDTRRSSRNDFEVKDIKDFGCARHRQTKPAETIRIEGSSSSKSPSETSLDIFSDPLHSSISITRKSDVAHNQLSIAESTKRIFALEELKLKIVFDV